MSIIQVCVNTAWGKVNRKGLRMSSRDSIGGCVTWFVEATERLIKSHVL